MLTNNINYSFEEYGIEFSYTGNAGNWGTSILQLPTTPDSLHVIDSESFDSDNDTHKEIFKALKDFYYDDFKGVECAKASACIGSRVIHVETVSNTYYVAFTAAGAAAVLTEGRAASYYNVFYFEKNDDFEINEDEIIVSAKSYFFKALKNDLAKKLNAENQSWEDGGFPTAGEYVGDEKAMAENCPDVFVGEFMRDQFESDWQDNEIAMEFYENFACDCRGDAEYDALRRLETSVERI